MRPKRNQINLGESGSSQIYQKVLSVPNRKNLNFNDKNKKSKKYQTFIDGESLFIKKFKWTLNKFISKVLNGNKEKTLRKKQRE